MHVRSFSYKSWLCLVSFLITSESPNQTSWLAAKNKVLGKQTEKKDEVFKAAKELIRLKRREKATDFITHVTMAKAYKPFKKFEGECSINIDPRQWAWRSSG